MGEWIYGKPVSDAVCGPLAAEVNSLRSRGVVPCLGIVRLGDSVDDLAYERGATRKCRSLGIETRTLALPEDTLQQELIFRLACLNADEAVHGILLLRPFPEHIDEIALRKEISPGKDVDGFCAENLAKLYEGDLSGFQPCTPSAVVEMLKHYQIPISGKHVVVLGRSMIVGMPVSMMLLRENATVTICHSKTEKIARIAANADILVSAVGRCGFVDERFIKPGAVVMDIGVSKDADNNLSGDVCVDAVLNRAGRLTPVIGGVGVITTSILARHVVRASGGTLEKR